MGDGLLINGIIVLAAFGGMMLFLLIGIGLHKLVRWVRSTYWWIRWFSLILLFTAILSASAHGQPLPDSPTPHLTAASEYAAPFKPVVQSPWITRPSTLAIFQSAAMLADGITTARMPAIYHELDPVTRPLIGYRPTMARMVPLGIAEVGVSYFLARRFPKMRWLQIGLTATHAGCAAHNSTLSGMSAWQSTTPKTP